MNLVPAFVRKRLAHRPNLLKILDNIGWLFLDKVLRMGVGLLVGVWIARYLGPEQFGLLNFALAFTGMFAAIATLGLQGIVVRDIVRDPQSAGVTLGSAAVLQLIGGFVSYLLILIAIFYLRPDDPLARTIVAILGAMNLFKASEIALYWFESQVQSKYTVWVQNGVFLLFAGVKVALILSEASLEAFVWATVVEAVVVAALMLVAMGRYGPALNTLNASVERAKALFKNSWPLMLSVVAILLNMNIDKIMLGYMIGDEEVGIYGAAVLISGGWYFIPIVIVTSVFPDILEAKKSSEDLYLKRLQQLYDLMAIIGILVALPMTFLAPLIVEFLFGSGYSGAGPVLALHNWACVFGFLGVACNRWYIAEALQNLEMKRTVLGMCVNLVLNVLFIPSYGAMGAAVATLLSQAVANYFADFLQKETRKVFLMKSKSLNVFSAFSRSLMPRWISDLFIVK